MQPPTSSTNYLVLWPEKKQNLNPSLFSFAAGPPRVLHKTLIHAALMLLHSRFAKHLYPPVCSLPAFCCHCKDPQQRGRGILWQPELAQLGGFFREEELGEHARHF